MGYVIRHSTGSINRARKKGKVAFGVSSKGYDKTSVSGLYNGVPPVAGKHNLVRVSSTNDPDFYALSNAELINFANQLGGSASSVSTAKSYLNGRDDIMFTDELPDNTVASSLVLELDASNLSSYPETGTTWYDLSGKEHNSTLTNGPTFNNNLFEWDGTNDYSIGWFDSDLLTGDYTIEAEFYHEGTSQWEAVWSNNAATSSWSNSTKEAPILTFSGNSYPSQQYYIGHNAVGTSGTGVWLDLTSDHINKWVKIWLTRSGTNISIYSKWFNKDISNSGTFSSYSITPRDGYIVGRHWYNSGNGGQTFNGKISNIKVYNKVLSQSEISQNYYSGPIVTDDLVFAIDAGNLVSYESGSTTAYSLTGSYTASVLNGVAYDSSKGGIWDFDGTNDKIELSNTSYWKDNVFGNATNFTIMCWTKCDNFYNWSSMIHKDNGGYYSESEGASLWVNNAGFQAVFGNGIPGNSGNWGNIISYSTSNTTDWFHLAFTGDGSTLKFYVNNVLVGSQGQSNRSAGKDITDNPVRIGVRANSAWYNGKIALPLFYTRSLTKEEVAQNYNAQKARFL